MSGREAILGKVRHALSAPADEGRRAAVEARLARPVKGLIPARGKLPAAAQVELFCTMAQNVAATVARVARYEQVPALVAAYLRGRNLPASLRMGADNRLRALPWDKVKALEIKTGPSDGYDEVGLSHAYGAVAETGTLVMVSGTDNPTTINFLPEHHIVVVDAKDVDGDLETVIARVRRKFGKGSMPRTVNMITGPSRSGDIEQKIILGAHGPRALHIIVVG